MDSDMILLGDSPTDFTDIPSPTVPLPVADTENGYNDCAEHRAIVAEKTTPTSMSCRWMITIWPDKVPDGWGIKEVEWPHTAEYWCWGLELAPTTQRQHYHVYMRFTKRVRFSQLLNALPDGACHIEMAGGSEQQCRDYCWSMGKHVDKRLLRLHYSEVGSFKPDEGKQGKRSDLQAVATKVLEGSDMADIAKEFASTYIRYHNGIEAFARTVAPKPPAQREVRVYVLWGPTGTGKTHRVLTAFPDACSVSAGKNPWDEYTGQQTLLLDEWRSSEWPISQMNKILDKWKHTLQCRYRNVSAAWTRVIICSNDTPGQFYSDEPNPDMRAAFMRRIDARTYLVEKKESEGGETLDEIMKKIDLC